MYKYRICVYKVRARNSNFILLSLELVQPVLARLCRAVGDKV